MHLSLLRSSGTAQDRFGEAMVFGRPVTVPVLGTETLPRVNHLEVGKQSQQLTRFEVGANHAVAERRLKSGYLPPLSGFARGATPGQTRVLCFTRGIFPARPR